MEACPYRVSESRGNEDLERRVWGFSPYWRKQDPPLRSPVACGFGSSQKLAGHRAGSGAARPSSRPAVESRLPTADGAPRRSPAISKTLHCFIGSYLFHGGTHRHATVYARNQGNLGHTQHAAQMFLGWSSRVMYWFYVLQSQKTHRELAKLPRSGFDHLILHERCHRSACADLAAIRQ